MTKSILIAAVALALADAAGAASTVSGDGACGIRAVDNESFVTCDGDRAPEPVVAEEVASARLPAAIPVTAQQAWQIKQDLGKRALLVDIRARADFSWAGRPFGADAGVPFMVPLQEFTADDAGGAPFVTYNGRFLEAMDERIVAAGLGFDDPVILLCRDGEASRLAGELMQEHGYTQMFAIADGFGGWMAASGYGRAALH